MATPAASSARLSPIDDGLSAGFGFLLIRRQIGDWGTAEPHQPSIAQAPDSEGRVISIAMKQLGPRELSSFVIKFGPRRFHAPAPLRPTARPDARPVVVATVDEHVLLLINGKLFLYELPSSSSSPALLQLPSTHSSAVDWQSHRRTTGITRFADTLAVVSLRPPEAGSTRWADLLRWFSSTNTWEVKPLGEVPENTRVGWVDTTVALGNGTMCWADFSTGLVLVDVFEENPAIRFINFPSSVTSRNSPAAIDRYRKNTLSFLEGRVTVITTKMQGSCGHEFLVLDLNIDTATWVQKSVIGIPWAFDFCPWFPTLNAQDPRLIYFLEQGENGSWYVHGMDTKAKSLIRERQRVPLACSNDEISATAPWVGMQLSTENEGTKRQKMP